jgi:putative sugar O-methyltransferase
MIINIVEKENKFWAQAKKQIDSDKEFENFKNWDFVKAIPIYQTKEFPEEYKADVYQLLNIRGKVRGTPENIRFKAALQEPKLGHTEESYAEALMGFDNHDCTSWTLKCAHHVLTYENATGRDIREYDIIIDFGAGIGEMGRFLRDIGYQNEYILYDLPEVAKISSEYLTRLDVKHRVVEHFKEIDITGKRVLFIGTWSLSEVPFSYRKEIANYFQGIDWLIVFQQEVFEYQNTQYFTLEFPKQSNTYIQLHHIPWHFGGKGNFYLFTQKDNSNV